MVFASNLSYNQSPEKSLKSNAQDGARLDIAANDFQVGRFERTFYIQSFQPLFAPSHQHSSLSSGYCKQESLKKRAYKQRIREVEHIFTPSIDLATSELHFVHLHYTSSLTTDCFCVPLYINLCITFFYFEPHYRQDLR